ncbi:mitochondrial folate carrier protein [Phlyctema vagabunda]|uniref:Mitochondrial folate carrier protein n=1 Tax=Phlyctema vagabunda TaxID=108571 RepID=A0ABR4PQQ6_9HELO
MQLSEESKERIGKVIDFSRVAIHYGYLPLIIYLGYTRSEPRPSFIRPRSLMPENHGHLSPSLVETVAGFSAGIISTIAVHPLDVIKTRLQIHRNVSSTAISSLSVLRSLTSNERPIQSLYRGLTPNLIGNSWSWAIFFYFKSIAETQIGALQNRPRFSEQGWKAGQYRLTMPDLFLASGVAGLLTSIGTAPIWVLKTRILSTDRGAKGAYEGVFQGAREIWKGEGIRGFYRGLGASCIGVSHGAVQFALYESMKTSWASYLSRTGGFAGETSKGQRGEEKLSNTANSVFSLSSKIIAGVTTYPYQPIRSRMQMQNAEERFGKGMSGVVAKIWREDGIKGFYRGVGTSVLRVLPATWVTFMAYENVRFYLPIWVGDRQPV